VKSKKHSAHLAYYRELYRGDRMPVVDTAQIDKLVKEEE